MIGPEGMLKLCEDLGVQPEEVRASRDLHGALIVSLTHGAVGRNVDHRVAV